MRKNTIITYLLLLFIAAITVIAGQQLAASNSGIRLWDWTVWAMLLLGLPFALMQQQAGLPDWWQPDISNKKRIIVPLITGLLFAVADVIVFIFILHPEPYESLPPFLQPFPYSVGLFISGAFYVEVFYRLIPVTLVLFIAKKFKASDKAFNMVYWVIAVLTALREPLEQLPDGAVWVIVYSFVTGFVMNFIQVIFYRKAGFMASLFTRLGHYLLWHILLGIYVEFVQLQ